MQTPPPPRLPLPRRLLDDAWWLASRLADRPARVIPFPAERAGGTPRDGSPKPNAFAGPR